MDGLDGHAARRALEDGEATRDRIADEFARIMGHTDGRAPRSEDRGAGEESAPIDVATYLLNPPPSPEVAERRARRQRAVGVISLGACLLLGVVLVAPWPGESTSATAPGRAAEPDPSPTASTATAADASSASGGDAGGLPKRLDVPGQPVRATRIDRPAPTRRVAPPRSSSTGGRGAAGSRQQHPVTAPRPATPAPARAPTPRPAAPSSGADAPVPLVPLS